MKKQLNKFDVASLLKNKNVLYVVLFLSVMNLFSYLMLKQLDAVAFFIIIGVLTTYFSKNMIIVMLTSVISTFLLVQIKLLGNVQEGLDTEPSPPSTTTPTADTAAIATETPETPETAAPPSPAAGGLQINGPARAKLITPSATKVATPVTATPVTTPMKKEKFSQKLSPANYNANDDDDVPRHKPKVDYAATLETAYDNLDKLLGSDAIRSMTEDTGRLAEKQRMLMGNIEKMTPVMEKAGSLLQSFDMGAITKLMENIGSNVNTMKSGMKSTTAAE
jgi:hypothetical protein